MLIIFTLVKRLIFLNCLTTKILKSYATIYVAHYSLKWIKFTISLAQHHLSTVNAGSNPNNKNKFFFGAFHMLGPLAKRLNAPILLASAQVKHKYRKSKHKPSKLSRIGETRTQLAHEHATMRESAVLDSLLITTGSMRQEIQVFCSNF